jgi:menaquinone-dependent protoporphyrinogen oxidase
MESKVLVAYASTHGSTREVAEAVAATLRAHALTVDLQPVRDVRTLETYSAVVLGAPLYMFHLHKDALRFLSRHQKALTGNLPIAVFAGGPFGAGDGAISDGAISDGNEWQEVRKQLDQELAKFPWLRPVATEVIGGKFDPTALHFPWNLIPALRKMPPSDLRDWEAIRRWASTLATQLQPAAYHGEEGSR